MKPLVSPIASQIERFLQFKRAVGCRYRDEERQLGVLDRFLASRLPSEDPVITDSIIRAYVKRSSHRLTILRQLCRFIALEEPRTVIPPPHFLGISRRPFVPRILTREEGRAFLKACLEDVDLYNGVIRIRRGKFGKSRFVPMAQDLTDRMEQCRLFVDRSLGIRPPSACFFPGPKGSRCTKGVLRYSFRIVLTEANIPYLGAGKGPRLHDLRHTYATG
jgi:integrase